MSNVIELRLLDHCVHPMCYVMYVMTKLRQYYCNSHKITKREDISNPFEVLERQRLDVENIVEKNKYLTILFFSQLCTHLHTCQKSHPYKQLSHLDTRHFVITECRHLANGCVLQCGCIGLMLFLNLSCLATIICYTNTIGIVPAYACNVCDVLVASLYNHWLMSMRQNGRPTLNGKLT